MIPKKIFFLLLLGVVLFPSYLRAELVDRVVAVVNDDVITLSEIELEGKSVFQRIASQVPASELESAVNKARQEILSSLIDKLLVEQRAKELNITASEEEIDAALQRVAANNNVDLESFKRRLVADGYDLDSYRQRLRWQILQSKLISYEISSKIVVTDEKAKQFYEKQYTVENLKDGYHILQIGLQWGEGRKYKTKDEVLRTAQEIRQQLENGISFTELAAAFSNLPSAKDGGDLGVFKKEELSGDMKAAILAMHPGDYSPVLETSDQTVQILKLLSVKSGDIIEQAPFESVKEEIVHRLQEEEMQKQFDRWVKDIREQAYIRQIL